MIVITAIARPTKKQLVNKLRERRGVRRTSHVRRELCELKRRGASRLYHRVDGRQRRLTRQPRSQRQQSATDATDAERRGGSQSYHRFDDSKCNEGATTWNASKGAKRRDDNDDDVDKLTKGAPRKQRMLREHAYKGRDCDTKVATRVTSPSTRR